MAVATVIHLSLVVTAISVCVCSAVISKMKLSENDIWSGEKEILKTNTRFGISGFHNPQNDSYFLDNNSCVDQCYQYSWATKGVG